MDSFSQVIMWALINKTFTIYINTYNFRFGSTREIDAIYNK